MIYLYTRSPYCGRVLHAIDNESTMNVFEGTIEWVNEMEIYNCSDQGIFGLFELLLHLSLGDLAWLETGY